MSHTFRDAHRPDLESGSYTLTASWKIDIDGEASATGEEKVDFFVAGERFSLNPSDIQAMYPPVGSRGDYSDCLPHIALARDTLPWERSAKGQDAPWLALLLLNADEAAACPVRTITLDAYAAKLPDGVRTSFHLQHGQTGADQVLTIEPPAGLLRDVLPTLAELPLLCHVRAGADGNVAVVVSRRLPHHGLNTVHLVSVEDRYVNQEFHIGGQANCTLVSLKSWTFTCEQPGAAGTESLDGLFARMDTDWLRLPSRGGAVWAYPSLGFVPLEHRFRTGELGVSWYAGPFVPLRGLFDGDALLTLPAKVADELLLYDDEIGMLNVTYAAAWQLGRMLALQNQRILTFLHDWRRQVIRDAHATAARSTEQGNIPQIQSALPRTPAKPSKELMDWIDGLRRLQGIPHHYLIPDERILPAESVRVFHVDPHWIRALVDGVFSTIRMPTEYATQYLNAELVVINALPDMPMSGFLIRSAAVTGWPGLQTFATDTHNNALSLDRPIQFSPSISGYLFRGTLSAVTIRQRPDTVHLSIEEHKNETSIWQNATRRTLKVSALDVRSGSAFARTWLHRPQTLEVRFGAPSGDVDPARDPDPITGPTE